VGLAVVATIRRLLRESGSVVGIHIQQNFIANAIGFFIPNLISASQLQQFLFNRIEDRESLRSLDGPAQI
jgi:hypothetical protein